MSEKYQSEKHQHEQVRSRNEAFAERAPTKIWSETPSEDNPYIAQSARCHGYDIQELMAKRSFTDVFYLLFKGELPSKDEAQILEQLMIALINPGPRHPATRAAMNVGIGKSNPAHILPIASSILAGEHMGGGNIESAMRFLRKQHKYDPQEKAAEYIANTTQPTTRQSEDNTQESLPGFGQIYGGVDLLTQEIANTLAQLPGAGKCLAWGQTFSKALNSSSIGWLNNGLAAAIFSDLGFQPRAGSSLFQLLGAPGLVAHGLELANKPITAMPYVSDEDYVIER